MSLRENKRLAWKEDIRAAKELCYPQKVIDMLTNEPNPITRNRILYDARNGKYDRK